MKSLFSLLLISLLGSSFLFGQCDESQLFGFYGFRPLSEKIPCVIKNESFNTFLLMKFGPDAIILDTHICDLRIDSIKGLPQGITYQLDKPSGEYDYHMEYPCINFYGATNSAVGKYPIYVYGNYTYRQPNGNLSIDTTTELVSFFKSFLDTSRSYPHLIARPYLEVVENEADCNHKLTTGISNYREEIKLEVYPNPASDQLFFKSDQRLKVEISNLKGQVVVQPKLTFSEMIQLDVSSLPKGIYFYKVESENGKIAFGKVIVTH